ncbi:hypothetical protein DID88_008973, partial [Monilinia fructigena]
DSNIRFGYADDICLYKASTSVDINVASLATRSGTSCIGNSEQDRLCSGEAGDDFTSPERTARGPQTVGSPGSRHTTITTHQERGQPALRWLGVWFDDGLLSKDTSRKEPGRPDRSLDTSEAGRSPLGFSGLAAARRSAPGMAHRHTRQNSLLAVRGVLPVWRTTPTVTLYRDAGIPSAEAMLEEAKLRFALRIQTVDEAHPLVRRITPPSSPAAEARAQGRWPRPRSRGWGPVPTGPQAYSQASTLHARLPCGPTVEWTKKRLRLPSRHGGMISLLMTSPFSQTGPNSIMRDRSFNQPISHVFDAEAIGAWRGLQHTLRMPQEVRSQRLWMCIDSTSVIWCLRANASASSQWAFIACQNAMQVYNIRIKWSPGHTGIEGNEAADRWRTPEHTRPTANPGPASLPTISDCSIFRDLRSGASAVMVDQAQGKAEPTTQAPRHPLCSWDFAWYYNKFGMRMLLQNAPAVLPSPYALSTAQGLISGSSWAITPANPPTSNAEGYVT